MATNGYGQMPAVGYPTQPQTASLFVSPTNYYQQNNGGINWVQGQEGAKAFTTMPGIPVLLMDSEQQTFYIKFTDYNGVPQPLKIYDYVERQEVQQPEQITSSEYVPREEFNDLKKHMEELKQMLDELTK